eukprot:8316883-Alexandrium_andersonii.AAC.1
MDVSARGVEVVEEEETTNKCPFCHNGCNMCNWGAHLSSQPPRGPSQAEAPPSAAPPSEGSRGLVAPGTP